MALIKKENYLKTMRKSIRSVIWAIFIFSSVTNIVMLMMPIYSLQVFDRVMSSGSLESLVALTAIAFFLFALYGVFNGIREVIMLKVSGWIDRTIGEKLFKLSINHASMTGEKLTVQFFQEATQVRNFLTSQAIFSIFDVPWSFVFLFVIWVISPKIFLLVAGVTVILFFLTFLKEVKTKPTIKETNEIHHANMRRADEYIRYAETIDSMGMLPYTYEIWKNDNDLVVDRNMASAKFTAIIGSISKALRTIMQVSITGLGVYLALQKEMTFGGIIACSTLAGKAVQPFDALMGMWGSFANVRDSFKRLSQFFDVAQERPENMNVGKPKGDIEVDKLVFAKQGGLMPIPILKGLSFKIDAGDVVGIIGPSASGKSTLVKLIAGIYKPYQGFVRLDGGDIFQRSRQDVGKYIGYLPQTIDLLRGSVKQNISRFDVDAKDDDVVQAAMKAGVHELVLSLPEQYNTILGDGKIELSGGQRQRIALARAFYGDPSLIILDEPNSNLDEVGERMLLNAILTAKKEGRTIIMITHKPAIVNITNKVVVIKDGQLADFGSTEEIMGKYAKNSANMKSYTDIINKAKDE
ncbi:MAG: type I secretion system permease/ATPase [Rickettsiales bacterium]|nr:type I secretion system permease/ATPase [Rickettsiales bacterium]